MYEILGALAVILFFVLMAYIAYKIVKDIFLMIIGLFTMYSTSKNTRLTNLHYFDHADRYFDYNSNQWHFKETN